MKQTSFEIYNILNSADVEMYTILDKYIEKKASYIKQALVTLSSSDSDEILKERYEDLLKQISYWKRWVDFSLTSINFI